MLIFTDNFYNGQDAEGDADAVRAVIKGYISAYARHKRIQTAGEPSPELALWADKLAEANNGGGVLLTAEAQVRGITVADLCAKVIAKSQQLKDAEAEIAGQAGKMKDALKNLTRDELLEFDWRF
jgi:hypothetical protein